MIVSLRIPLLTAVLTFVVWGKGLAIPSYALNFFGNLPQSNDNATNFISGTNGNFQDLIAVSFTLGAGQNYSLDQIILRLRDYQNSDIPAIQIRNDVGGIDPGSTILANFTNPPSQGSATFNYTFLPSNNFNLHANTKYWLMVAASAEEFAWRGSSPGIEPDGIPIFGDYRTSANGGISYTSGSVFNSFLIEATPIPPSPQSIFEPGSTIGLIVFVGTSLVLSKKTGNRE